MDTVDEDLRHYGVKGMKWGVRRTDAQLRRARKEREVSEDAKATKSVHAKKKENRSTDALTNQELKLAIERMNLEQQYNRLAPKTATQKGAAFISNMMTNVGKQQIQRAVNDQAGQMVGEYLKNK